MEEPLGIVLADSQTLFLDVLAPALQRAGNRVLARATTRHDLLDAIDRRRPDLAVTDSALADGEVIEAIGAIRAVHPATRVVVLSADARPDTMRRALDAGACGFIHKSRSLPAVLDALDRVIVGDVVTARSISERHPARSNATHYLRRLATYLTPRELECLRLLALGLDTAEMARRLEVSAPTVRSHVQAVLAKLGAHSRTEAASLAIRHGLVATGADSDGLDRSG